MSSSRHGGNVYRLAGLAGVSPQAILDFSANLNPLGPPEWLRPLVSSILASVIHYPDPDYTELALAAARRYGCSTDELIAGNGSSEILYLLPRALPRPRAIIMAPSYMDYATAIKGAGLACEPFLVKESEGFVPKLSGLESQLTGDELVFLCNPNNPTGLLFDSQELRKIARRHPSSVFIVDEAFADFVDRIDSLVTDRPENVVVLLSLTKIFAIPGLRLGCAIADPQIIDAMRQIQPPWSVSTLAQEVGRVALNDLEYIERTRHLVGQLRSDLAAELQSIPGITVYPGTANFLLVRIDRSEPNAVVLADRLLAVGIAIRCCGNFDGLDDRFFRVAVKQRQENIRLCDALRGALGTPRKVAHEKHARALMFQGTGSNAGKSLLTAALGRILLQDGYRVAPFKAQNMSLNSFVTRTGGEMGRAQVVQAQACKLDPDVRMNPVLLKPNSDTGSQVIVWGKPVGNMDAMEYVRYKPQAFEAVKAAYDSLANEFDVIVLEGAGSPGEVNLKHHDIVNMRMAEYACAPVLLVGDIDRGGVFASFVGTMEVLAEWERALVAGFVVNRFRGNKELLRDALEYTRRHTGRPVLGVVPYLHNHGLPEEDSVSFKCGAFDIGSQCNETVEIAIIDLPHISNFTDFDSLRIEPDVRVAVVRTVGDFNRPDAVILPGSKNTIGDLQYLRETGIERALRQLAVQGVELVGICGGFQMLGADIADPHRMESESGKIEGLGFLNITTVLARDKTLTRSEGIHLESGLIVRGYEIHHGISSGTALEPLVQNEKGEYDGARSQDSKVWGTYFHGIFDSDEFRRWFIDRLRDRKGLTPMGRVCASYDLEPALDRLANVVRESVDMPAIYRLLGL